MNAPKVRTTLNAEELRAAGWVQDGRLWSHPCRDFGAVGHHEASAFECFHQHRAADLTAERDRLRAALDAAEIALRMRACKCGSASDEREMCLRCFALARIRAARTNTGGSVPDQASPHEGMAATGNPAAGTLPPSSSDAAALAEEWEARGSVLSRIQGIVIDAGGTVGIHWSTLPEAVKALIETVRKTTRDRLGRALMDRDAAIGRLRTLLKEVAGDRYVRHFAGLLCNRIDDELESTGKDGDA